MIEFVWQSFEYYGVWLYPMTILALVGLMWLPVQLVVVHFGTPLNNWQPVSLPRISWVAVPLAIAVICCVGVGMISMNAVEALAGATGWEITRDAHRGAGGCIVVAFLGGLYCAVLGGMATVAMGIGGVFGDRPLFGAREIDGIRGAAGGVCFVVLAGVAVVIFQLGSFGGSYYGISIFSRGALALTVLAGGIGCGLAVLSRSAARDEHGGGRGPARYTAAATYLFALGGAVVAGVAVQGRLVLDALEQSTPENRGRLLETGMELMGGIIQIGAISAAITGVVVLGAMVVSGGRKSHRGFIADKVSGGVAALILLAAIAVAANGLLEFWPEFESAFG